MAYKIVLVDDDEKIAELLGQSLRSQGHTVKTFNDSLEAKDFLLNNNEFNVLVSDNIMPKLNGSDLISQCLELRDDVFYILATGDDSYNFIDFNEIKNVMVISKPYKRRDIIKAVGEYFS